MILNKHYSNCECVGMKITFSYHEGMKGVRIEHDDNCDYYDVIDEIGCIYSDGEEVEIEGYNTAEHLVHMYNPYIGGFTIPYEQYLDHFGNDW